LAINNPPCSAVFLR